MVRVCIITATNCSVVSVAVHLSMVGVCIITATSCSVVSVACTYLWLECVLSQQLVVVWCL